MPLETLADTTATVSACTSVQSTASYSAAEWLQFNCCREILLPKSPRKCQEIY